MGNYNNLLTGRMTKGIDPSGMKVWITSPRKELRLIEVLAEGGWKVKDYRMGGRGR